MLPPKSNGSRSEKAEYPLRLDKEKHYHFLGIGGVGMSGLAAILHQWGYKVSGSDAHEGEALDALSKAGISVSVGHDAAALNHADAVVFSTAIGANHPIWKDVIRLSLPAYHRAEVMGALAADRRTLAVTGTHGKTTSSAALALCLMEAGWDPTVLVGGAVTQLEGGNQRGGHGKWLVCEADESDGSFINLAPEGVMLTNVETDHLDHHGSLDNLIQAFEGFLERITPDGLLVYCGDNRLAKGLGNASGTRSIVYGIGEMVEYRVHIESQNHEGMNLILQTPNGEHHLTTRMTGKQNAVNLCGVFALGQGIGIPHEPMLKALSGFEGVERRQQFIGQIGDLKIYDDYAHHPTEVQVTLEQFLATHGEPITIVFQPHLYSRTQYFAGAFARELSKATRVFVTEVYGAREQPIAGVSGRMIVERMSGHPDVTFVPDWQELEGLVSRGKVENGVLLTLGAGDVTKLGPRMLQKARTKDKSSPPAKTSKSSKSPRQSGKKGAAK